MTTPKTLPNYGGPYSDQEPVANPRTQVSAVFGNRAFEDLAQLTRPRIQALVVFTTQLVDGACVVNASKSNFAGFAPTVARTGVGVYALTLTIAGVDGLGVIEILSSQYSKACVIGALCGHAQSSGFSGTRVFSALGTPSDLGGGVKVRFTVYP